MRFFFLLIFFLSPESEGTKVLKIEYGLSFGPIGSGFGSTTLIQIKFGAMGFIHKDPNILFHRRVLFIIYKKNYTTSHSVIFFFFFLNLSSIWIKRDRALIWAWFSALYSYPGLGFGPYALNLNYGSCRLNKFSSAFAYELLFISLVRGQGTVPGPESDCENVCMRTFQSNQIVKEAEGPQKTSTPPALKVSPRSRRKFPMKSYLMLIVYAPNLTLY